MNHPPKRPTTQAGFTIIELMIATAVLSVILVLVTVVMVNIGRLYYKGINQARAQDSVRSLADELAQNIRLSGQPLGPVTKSSNANIKAYCTGAVRYTYVLGAEIGHPGPGTASPVYQHILWRDQNPTPGSCSADPDLTSTTLATTDPGGVELITGNARLTQFTITPGTATGINIEVAYGDNDLLCNPTVISSSCNTPTQMAAGSVTATSSWPNYTGNVQCKGSIGSQFCATAGLQTAVVLRLGQ